MSRNIEQEDGGTIEGKNLSNRPGAMRTMGTGGLALCDLSVILTPEEQIDMDADVERMVRARARVDGSVKVF